MGTLGVRWETTNIRSLASTSTCAHPKLLELHWGRLHNRPPAGEVTPTSGYNQNSFRLLRPIRVLRPGWADFYLCTRYTVFLSAASALACLGSDAPMRALEFTCGQDLGSERLLTRG